MHDATECGCESKEEDFQQLILLFLFMLLSAKHSEDVMHLPLLYATVEDAWSWGVYLW